MKFMIGLHLEKNRISGHDSVTVGRRNGDRTLLRIQNVRLPELIFLSGISRRNFRVSRVAKTDLIIRL